MACFAKGNDTMLHNTTLTGFTQSCGLDEHSCIRLRANHSSYARAVKLLATLAGRRFIPAAGMVCASENAAERDAALDQARRQLGWTVGTSFDGRPWLPGDPGARWLT